MRESELTPAPESLLFIPGWVSVLEASQEPESKHQKTQSRVVFSQHCSDIWSGKSS